MNYIILVRNPHNKRVLCIADDDAPTMFDTEEEAEDCAKDQALCRAFGYQIVELEI